ncbi:type 2 isopentenyl-diphosphate Delta-isomerase [Lentilactobacillus kefiri]|uniref:Isopentenyl-diphosphate delta-isomerase n=1 Tax=Lentilactobacillus kefiri TaxID=33962 RepID=A0A511DSY3_LENKE|nr:type 2 isopentenyl-diphosphate Delta-isomerase [Lentilactobacillus kefiri]KRL62722.1 isopentenyl-diphosphate delta-isomerase [Lentilactobacillus parakefiri DSM 10551]MCJ2160675.1 type 2 isopentenyl-diphosphate Delta-isomerase [Lentilactobacillus kefiri]MCP9367930.1 type 2 isopentenyl-diphosphate Delta-isomerase [Lentilactobacillus kefiri]MDH5107520.1 type 2 isopentenyl-diphosphate Delta-isomerase [Lentilactobacillus kefiri]MDM7491896.1 type 2 isopentenyl-diphosphate Delta-isomerase [Lentila
MISQHSHRKDEHVSLAEKFYTDNDMFNNLRFVNNGLPKYALNDIDFSTKIGPLDLKTPFYIEAMSGGSEHTKKINQRLADIARKTGLAMAVGSESVGLSDPSVRDSFKIVRQTNPNGLIFANIGANHSLEDAQKAVDLISADALELHINVAQELIMPEGDRQFQFIENIQKIVANIKVPVIVKEVGFGMSKETIQELAGLGVQYINVSGRGGTNFATIENFRRPSKDMDYLKNWGLITVESLLESRALDQPLTTIASGGVKSPLDVAKCLAMGASAVGVAGYFLHEIIHKDDDAIVADIKDWQYGLKTIMLMLNCQTIADLKRQRLILNPELISYLNQRNIKY